MGWIRSFTLSSKFVFARRGIRACGRREDSKRAGNSGRGGILSRIESVAALAWRAFSGDRWSRGRVAPNRGDSEQLRNLTFDPIKTLVDLRKLRRGLTLQIVDPARNLRDAV
jgi:hypothetical protein